MGKQKISTGKQQKQGSENALNSNLAGKHIFLAGHPFGEAAFQRGGGGCTRKSEERKSYEMVWASVVYLFLLNCTNRALHAEPNAAIAYTVFIRNLDQAIVLKVSEFNIKFCHFSMILVLTVSPLVSYC